MTSPDSVLTGSYDHILVALSVLIAILASYAALDLARHVTSAQGRARLLWLTGGANAMGFGIWSMHEVHHARPDAARPGGAGYGAVRLADGLVVSIGCDSRVCHSSVCRKPEQDGGDSSCARQHLHGRRNRNHALHRHGRDALTGDMQLFDWARNTFGASRDRDFLGGLIPDVLFPGRHHGVELEENAQRNGDGSSDPGHALHRHGRRQFYALQFRSSRPISRRQRLLSRRRRYLYRHFRGSRNLSPDEP